MHEPESNRIARALLSGVVGTIRSAYLFGSTAAGCATAESDVDVAVDAGDPLTWEARTRVAEAVTAVTGREVDVICLDLANHLIAANSWELPRSARDAFHVLTRHGTIDDATSWLPDTIQDAQRHDRVAVPEPIHRRRLLELREMPPHAGLVEAGGLASGPASTPRRDSGALQ